MFGEKELIGIDEIKLYSNNKFILPDYTFAEKKEELLFLKNIKYLCLFNEKKLEDISNRLLPLIKKNNSYDYYQRFVRTLFGKMITSEIVNSKKQISIPKEWIKDYNFNSKIIVEGNIDHLKIFPNRECFNEYKLKKSQK